MLIFLALFIVFLIWFRVKLKRSNSNNSSENKAFWEREEKANFSRKQTLDSLSYLKVPEDALPFLNTGDEKEAYWQKQVKECLERKMLNLSEYTNTDLKEMYGVANLEELSNCDQNFLLFIRALSQWGNLLYEQEDFVRAKQVMEYSLSIGSDISTVFIVLGNIYAREGAIKKVDELIDIIEASDMSLKESTIKQLKLCKIEY